MNRTFTTLVSGMILMSCAIAQAEENPPYIFDSIGLKFEVSETGKASVIGYNRDVFNKENWELNYYLETVTHNGTTYDIDAIGDGAFENSPNLRWIEKFVSIVSIGDRAFKDCINLPLFRYNEVLTTIGESAFENCSQMHGLTISPELKSIGANAFKGTGLAYLSVFTDKMPFDSFESCFGDVDFDNLVIVVKKDNDEIKPESYMLENFPKMFEGKIKADLITDEKFNREDIFIGELVNNTIQNNPDRIQIRRHCGVRIDDGMTIYAKPNTDIHIIADVLVGGGALGVSVDGDESYESLNSYTHYYTVPMENGGKTIKLLSGGSSVKEIETTGFRSGDVYDIMGRKIKTISDKSELNQLPKGIYILDGKKVAVSCN